MKADLTRSTFNPKNHFERVVQQQGRVQLDADSNEQVDILLHRIGTESVDVIGRCGAPYHDAGFALQPQGNTLTISKGRYYVSGLMCENEQPVSLFAQPD